MPPPTKVKVNLHVDTRRTTHLNIGDDVEFVSSQDCTIYFTDPAVFGTPELDLSANQPSLLTIQAEGATQYCVLEPASRRQATAMISVTSSPNDIVVP